MISNIFYNFVYWIVKMRSGLVAILLGLLALLLFQYWQGLGDPPKMIWVVNEFNNKEYIVLVSYPDKVDEGNQIKGEFWIIPLASIDDQKPANLSLKLDETDSKYPKDNIDLSRGGVTDTYMIDYPSGTKKENGLTLIIQLNGNDGQETGNIKVTGYQILITMLLTYVTALSAIIGLIIQIKNLVTGKS